MAFQYNIIKIFEEERAEARAEGRAEGRAQGKSEAVVELLEELGVVPEELREKILAQDNLDTLKQWNILAAHAETIEGFVACMEEG